MQAECQPELLQVQSVAALRGFSMALPPGCPSGPPHNPARKPKFDHATEMALDSPWREIAYFGIFCLYFATLLERNAYGGFVPPRQCEFGHCLPSFELDRAKTKKLALAILAVNK
jgi:hypothetical protein